MIYFLCIGILCLSGLIGKKIAKTVVVRDEFYKFLCSFCDYIKMNISLYQIKINDLFDGYVKNYPSKFEKELIEFKKYVCDDNKNKACGEIKFLKPSEHEELKNFLIQLGVSDECNQISHIDNFKQLVLSKAQECKNIRKVNEGLIYKVSLAIGSIICILII